MTQEELNSILRLHKAWLIGKEFGERAELGGADLRRSDLRGADLQGAILRQAILEDSDLQDAILRGADLRRSDLRDAALRHSDLRSADLWNCDLRGADIDYASWPLWCGSLKAYVDDRIAIQLLYHTLSVVQYSPFVSEEVKKALLSAENVRIANRFHRAGACGEIKEWEEEE